MFLARFLRPITRLRITPAPPAPDRAGVAIVLIVKNEARHIAEWARFHHRAGVAHFIVYDNASTDGTADRLREALPAGALTLVPWAQSRFRTLTNREIHNQVLAYALPAVWCLIGKCESFRAGLSYWALMSMLEQPGLPELPAIHALQAC